MGSNHWAPWVTIRPWPCFPAGRNPFSIISNSYFAQVTNPPIDALREELVTATELTLGSEGNLLAEEPGDCRRIKLKTPILTDQELAKLRYVDLPGFQAVTLPILFPLDQRHGGLGQAMDELCQAASEAIRRGANLIILSDRDLDRRHVAIPALLATAGLHHHLIRQGSRTRVSLLVESGEPREVHHFATLIGYGADAVNPYLAYETIGQIIDRGFVQQVSYDEARSKFIRGRCQRRCQSHLEDGNFYYSKLPWRPGL